MEQNKEKTLPKGHYDSFAAQLSRDIKELKRKSLKKKALKKYINL